METFIRLSLSVVFACNIFFPKAILASGIEEEGIEEMLFTDLPVVVSSTKSEKNLIDAPSSITVWTQEDIKKTGARTIKELLERTPGFFPSMQPANEVLGSRGMIMDGNEAFLLLIDGHNMNNINSKGMGTYYAFPNIEKVQQVEIIRGPGSTLWGNDAALGIINIITKQGADIDGLKVTADYRQNGKGYYVNLLYGKEHSNGKGSMFSFTQTRDNGYPYGGSTPVTFSWGANSERKGPISAHPLSWEFFGKIDLGDSAIKCFSSDYSGTNIWTGPGSVDNLQWSRIKNTWGEFETKNNLSGVLSLTTKVFFDFIQVVPHTETPITSPRKDFGREVFMSREHTVGLDVMLNKTMLNHNLKIGSRIVQTTVEPVYSAISITSGSGSRTNSLDALIVPDERDKSAAVFIEDEWKATDNLEITAGVRADHNNLREEGSKILPRLGAVYSISEKWRAKYLFNTGYVRPPLIFGLLGMEPVTSSGRHLIGADKSENILSHDIELIYNNKESFDCKLTVFQVEMQNLLAWSGKDFTENGIDYQLFQINVNDVKSTGFEFELRHKLTDYLNWYANYSYAIAEVNLYGLTIRGQQISMENSAWFTDGKRMTGYPSPIFNLGSNLAIGSKVLLNTNLRGWTDAISKVHDPNYHRYKSFGPEYFADLNVTVMDCFVPSLDCSIHATNIADNRAEIPFVAVGGYYPSIGAAVSFKMSYKF